MPEITLNWWKKLSDSWKKIFAINYVFAFRFSDQMKQEILVKGVNPFKNYLFKLQKEFTLFDMDEVKIQKLQSLDILYASGCAIKDITPLSVIKNLLVIDLSFNEIESVDAIGKCIYLRELILEKNVVKKINSISGLTGLEQLNLRENKISDLTPLSKLNKLSFLDISNNNITEIGCLDKLVLLKEIQCSLNNINKATVLKDLKKIEVIDISSNKIKDASFIFDLPVLKYADISSNEIDITAYQWKKLTENGLNLKL